VTAPVPILVGVTGKRDLKGEDDYVRQRLAQAFDILDRQVPDAPKVLLTGMAIGADLIAAELAVARPNWLVAAVLPMALDLYLEDWTELAAEPCGGSAAAATARERLAALLQQRKVKVCALPPLRDPHTGAPRTADALHVGAGAINELRRQHYEQLGLWLARTATLLIAVAPDGEQPGQLGGTARIVDYRLAGRPDAAARAVMRTSDVVCEPLPLDVAGFGPVWLIDAPQAAPRHDERKPFRVLFPKGEEPRGEHWPFARELRASLTAARGFNRLADLTATASLADFGWHGSGADPTATVTAIHGEVDRIQGRFKQALVRSSYALAGLFFLAVFTYGCTGLAHGPAGSPAAPIGLLIYLGFVMAAVIWHWVIGSKRWQRLAEDYRSVNEALRVQRAWWYAGLNGPDYHVDRYYLVGAQQPFLYLRQAVRNITGWALLNALPAPPAPDWSRVYEKDNVNSWLGEQLDYFRNRAGRREQLVLRSQMLSWEMFFAAQFLAAWLCADILTEERLRGVLDRLLAGWGGVVRAALFLALAVLLWTLRHVRDRRAAPRRRSIAIFAVLMALLIGPGLHFLAAEFAPANPVADQTAIALAVVFLSTAAVAVRFVADKLVWEAEAHRYQDALALCERAEAELVTIDGESHPAEIALRRKQNVIFALGRSALDENEYWLRAHRERPIEQAVG